MKIGKLTIIVPVFNEVRTIGEVIKRLKKFEIKNMKIEIIIVDDGSQDGTTAVLNSKIKNKNSKLKEKNTTWVIIYKKRNEGKGAAIRTGLKYAKGDYVIIQDADLEYHPNEIKKLVIKAQKYEVRGQIVRTETHADDVDTAIQRLVVTWLFSFYAHHS